LKSRLVLTLIWLFSFIGALVLVEALYVDVKSPDGLYYLSWEDRWEAVQPLLMLYSPYLAGILAFWYTKPFKLATSDVRDRVRAGLGITTALILNAVVLYFVLRVRLLQPLLMNTEASVIDDIATGAKFAGALSILVAPANAYFFGFEPKAKT
jgi:hypothetical protein